MFFLLVGYDKIPDVTILKNIAGRAAPPQSEAPVYKGPIRPSAIVQPVAQGGPLPDDFLVEAIEQQDVIPDQARTGIRTGYTHVSTLVNVCSRREVLANRFSDQILRTVRSPDRVVWTLGRSAEDHVRKQVLKARNNQGVYGKWSCRCGHTFHLGLIPDQKTVCERCQLPLNRFSENPIFDHDAMIVGNCDLPIVQGRIMVPYEIKSIKVDGFLELVSPLGDHILQALLYRDLYERSGWQVHDDVGIIYVCKDYPSRKTKSIYKEYHVNGTSAAAKAMVTEARQHAYQIKESLNTNVIPKRRCTSVNTSAARECPMVSLCFNLPN